MTIQQSADYETMIGDKDMEQLAIIKSKQKTQFYIILTLTILSWLIPDALPFIDEIFLAYLSFVKFRQLLS